MTETCKVAFTDGKMDIQEAFRAYFNYKNFDQAENWEDNTLKDRKN